MSHGFDDSGSQYDAHGNRTSVPATSYTYDPAGTLRLVQQGSGANAKVFTYDNNGNLWTESPNKTYAYTPHNLLESATVGDATTTYAYDGDDWRVKKASGTSSTYYLRGLNGELLCEWTNPGEDGQTRRDYVYAGPQQLIAVISK